MRMLRGRGASRAAPGPAAAPLRCATAALSLSLSLRRRGGPGYRPPPGKGLGGGRLGPRSPPGPGGPKVGGQSNFSLACYKVNLSLPELPKHDVSHDLQPSGQRYLCS